MAELPFFPMAIDAYLADTRHLSDAEHGRYHLILYELWRAPKQRLPNEDAWLARRLCRSVERIVEEIRPLIKEFCDCDGNWITQKRLSKEFLRARKVTKQRSDAAKALWKKKKQLSERIREDAQPRIGSADEPTPTLRPTPTHTPTVVEERYGASADDGVQADALAIWNETAERCGWPLAQKLSEPRKRSLKGRLEECGGLDGWRIALDKMAASPFFRSKWTPGFDWILKPANLTKVMEGNYDERANTQQGLGAVLAELGRLSAEGIGSPGHSMGTSGEATAAERPVGGSAHAGGTDASAFGARPAGLLRPPSSDLRAGDEEWSAGDESSSSGLESRVRRYPR